MMLKYNYHTHMKYCNHAKGDVIDYVKEAHSLGYIELGMSDHAPIPLNSMTKEEWEHNYCSENMTLEIFEKYLDEIEDAQEKFKDMKVFKGLESEYLEDHNIWYQNLRNKLDYMILGLHFFKDPDTGKVLDTYQDMNNKTIYNYYQNMENAIKSGLFDYIAHPDLFLFKYNGNDVSIFDKDCEIVTRKICELSLKYDIPLEMNVNGIRFATDMNDINKWRYPNIKFWNIASEYKNLKVVIGLDAHDVSLFHSENIEKVMNLAKSLGINITKFEVKK